MKRIISLVLALIFAFSFSSYAFALSDKNFADIDSKIDKSTDYTANSSEYVYDLANLLYKSDMDELTNKIATYYEAFGVKFFLITTNSAYGETTETFINDFVNKYCDTSTKSVVFGVDLDNDQVYVTVSSDLESSYKFKEMQTVYTEALKESKTDSSYDWDKYFTLVIEKSIIAINGDYSKTTEKYTAPNGYSYAYFAPYYDTLLETAHKYDNVWDFADLLTDEEEANLQKLSESRLAEKGINIFFLTYDNAFGENHTQITADFFDFYITKLDFDNEVSGLLYAIDMDNRQTMIMGGGSVYISTDDEYRFLDKTYQYATNEDYFQFFVSTDKVTMKGLYPSALDKAIPTSTSLMASVIVAVVLVVIVLAIQKKSNKKPVADVYQSNFRVNSRNAVFAGHREEVIVDFYKPSESSGGGGGGGGFSSGGGGSHSGGGGHGF